MKIFITDLSEINEKLFSEYEQLLDRGEQGRFARISHPNRRLQFLVGRALLKEALSKVLGKVPQEIKLTKQESGKLTLAENSPWHFNIAHSKDMVVVALGNHEVGIDVEFMRNRDFANLAEMSFSKEEIEQIRALNGNAQKELFYKFWTQKEAYIKCYGGNIFEPFDGAGVSFHSVKLGDYIIAWASQDVKVEFYKVVPFVSRNKESRLLILDF